VGINGNTNKQTMKKLEGQLSEWFMKAKEEELVFLDMMSPGSVGRLCVLLTLEQQLLLEKSKKRVKEI
jgi:hypothetical protein